MSKKIYGAVNGVVIVLSVILFFLHYKSALLEMRKNTVMEFALLFLVAIGVSVIKAFRFYFILGGESVTGSDFIRQYCKTVPVSTLFPLKTGEIFKMYCFGYLTNGFFSGIMYVLLDRFFDTFALLFILIVLSLTTGQELTLILCGLSAAVITIMVLYLVLPNQVNYWKKYFLQMPATSRNLRYLRFLSGVEATCDKIKGVLRGKAIFTIIVSLVAWLLELAGMFFLGKLNNNAMDSLFFQNYLLAALGLKSSAELDAFVIAMMIVLFIAYILLRIIRIHKEVRL